MKFVTIREFRNKTAEIRKKLKTEQEMLLTANGQPFAMLVDVMDDSFEEMLAGVRRTRAHMMLDRSQARAKALGLDKMTMEEIDAEIAKAREEKRVKR